MQKLDPMSALSEKWSAIWSTAKIRKWIVLPIRYVEHGIRSIPANLVETSRQIGCTAWQRLIYVEFPVAKPEIVLGINQTIMAALSMLPVSALVGTKDLGRTEQSRCRPGVGGRIVDRDRRHDRWPRHASEYCEAQWRDALSMARMRRTLQRGSAIRLKTDIPWGLSDVSNWPEADLGNVSISRGLQQRSEIAKR
jgi:hypothetical protein